MVDPNSFLGRFRRGKIPPPTARNFEEQEWQSAFSSQANTAEGEFIRAGLWFNGALRLRWQGLEDLGVADVPADLFAQHTAGIANVMQLRSDALMIEAALSADDDRAFASISQAKLGGPDENAATADMMRTSAIDVVGKALGYIRDVVAPRRGTGRLDNARLNQAYALFEDIYLLEYLWGRIAWCDWLMHEDGERLRFTPPTPDPAGVSFVVAEYRRHQLLTEFQVVFGMEWSARHSTLAPIWKVQAKRREGETTFEVSSVVAGQQPLSVAYLLRNVLLATELAPHLDEPLPRLGYPSVSLNDLIDAWELLSLAAEAVRDLLVRRKPSSGPLVYGPRLRRRELEALLTPLGWPKEKRSAVLEFLTYGPAATDGAWSKPFLRSGDHHLVPVLTPLICPNLIRTVELWASEGAGEAFFTHRGNAAEERLRRDLENSVAERAWFADVSILGSSWDPKIEGARRDMDLVLRVGRAVFVGELKHKKFPVSAAEVGRHEAEFRHAASQLDIRIPWLKANAALVAEKTGFAGDPASLSIQGFIVSGTAFGSGTSAGGYPIIDRDALTFFFENDAFLLVADPDRDRGYRGVARKPSLEVRLVDGDPAASLLAYIRDPMHVRLAEEGLVQDVRTNRLQATGQRLEWAEPHIDMRAWGENEVDALADRFSRRWEDQQARARMQLRPDPVP